MLSSCRSLGAIVCALAGCGGPAPLRPTTPPIASLRLVVLVVVDQLPSWSFTPLAGHLPGGVGRLVRDGVYVEAAAHPHAFTYTASGHAVLATGVPPSIHGVLANGWYRREEGAIRPAEHDPVSPVLGVPSSSASGAALATPGVADALRAQTQGRGRSVAISIKARAACAVAGQRPDLALWFEEDLGEFTTSAAYADELPRWVEEFNRAHAFAAAVPWQWEREQPVPPGASGIDDRPGEGAVMGLGTTFPHPVTSLGAALVTPLGNRWTTDLAIETLKHRELGADDVPDLLAISYSSPDLAGHIWGQGSWEQTDLLRSFDAELLRLFSALDERVGAGRYALIMTSDHGATPLVESTPGARRISPRDLEAVAETAAQRDLGPGDWVASVSSLSLYFTPQFFARGAGDRVQATRSVISALGAVPGMARVGEFAVLGCPRSANPADIALCNSFVPGRSGELYLIPADGSLITEYATGTHHDAPSEHNRRVPILAEIPGVARVRTSQPISTLTIAATLSRLLRIAPPPQAHRRTLFDELSASARARAKNAE